MALIYLVQHAEKDPRPGDPGLTDRGRGQAGCVASWLMAQRIQAVVTSPMRRARETAEVIADACTVPVSEDGRVRERLNWADGQPFTDFAEEWSRTVRDPDYAPLGGDSARRAGERLRQCVMELDRGPGPIAVVTHGGVTVDFLRLVVDVRAVEPYLDGVPSCAVTTVNGLVVERIASLDHFG
jgi:broad specificity phosphatase PhoE